MGETVKKLWPFMWADYKSAEKYLEKMAAKGLMLKTIDEFLFIGFTCTATYEKTSPQNRKYCIDGLSGSAEEIEEYVQMAQDAGWELITGDYGIGVFQSKEGESPVPLQTDKKTEYRQIRKSFWKWDIPLGIATLCLLYTLYRVDALVGTDSIFKNIDMTVIYILLFIVFSIAGLIRAVTFYIRSEISIRKEIPLKPLSERNAKGWGMLHSLTGLCVALFMMARLMNQLSITIFSGRLYEAVCCTIIAVSLVAMWIIAHFNIGKDSKYMKMIVVGLMIMMIIACFAYCTMGCEVVTEG